YQFDHIASEALGYSGGILCVSDSNVFHKKHHIISDDFVALYGTWIPRKMQLLIISVYAPQSYASKRQLWDFIVSLINKWNGECMVMGDFNEVRCKEDRWGFTFHAQGARSFNSFISNADGFLSLFPHISAVCLDRHLSDHRPILLREMLVDFEATPFRLYHSWFSIRGFDQMITSTWNSFTLVNSNGMIRLKKKLQLLKKVIRKWVAEYKSIHSNSNRDIKNKLNDIDKLLDKGGVTDDVLLSRSDLEASVSDEEIRKAVWGCGENKSPGPDGFTFEFFRKFWTVVGPDFCIAVKWFFEHGFFATGCNSSFVTLIQKTLDPKLVSYVFKVDFAKAYDSIRWDYLDDVLNAFGFGSRWRSWIQGSLNSGKASVLANGSPTSEFQFHRGLKQGDPLAPFLFILIMEPLHLSFNRAVEAGIFTLHNENEQKRSQWVSLLQSSVKLKLRAMKKSGPTTVQNLRKNSKVNPSGPEDLFSPHPQTALRISSSETDASKSETFSIDETVHKLTKRLSKWKLKTLSIGAASLTLNRFLAPLRFTTCLYLRSRSQFLTRWKTFVGIFSMITWVKWHAVLASKKFGGLVVSSFFALNRGLLAKWVWRFLSQDNSLWCQLISAIHGSSTKDLSTAYPSTWNSIIKEFNYLKVQGVDVFSHCKIRIGNGLHTRFWKDLWIGDCTLSGLFPRLFALDTVKDISVAALLDYVILSNSNDRWVSDLNGDGVFRVKDVRNLLDEFFLPRADVPTRWVKNIPIKVNIFAWRLALDRLPTRANLVQRNVVTESQSCPLCNLILEDTSHLFFNCSLARDVTRLLCPWWNLGVQTFSSYAEWLVWADVPKRWVKNIPIKVNIFAWRLALDRLPTQANLVQRNVVTESQSCPLCDAILEDTSHLFFNCSLARCDEIIMSLVEFGSANFFIVCRM
nr:RNA-directed DNA polymerase, eukaryota [Tanacetum cinerariifolium]